MNRYLILLYSLLISCSNNLHQRSEAHLFLPSESVTPSESLKIAEAYRSFKWTPSVENIQHNRDKNGVFINTPDTSLKAGLAGRPGWWKADQTNEGMPYKWGGFDTPQSFQEKLTQGFAAGDVYTQNKRKKLYNGVSEFACGVDCSGFVSRCWRLPRAYSTRELPDLCDELSSFADLKPGDIVNKRNVHVLLFERFLNKEKTHFLAYETGSPPSWKVLRHPISVNYVKGLGYRPYRYQKIVRNE